MAAAGTVGALVERAEVATILEGVPPEAATILELLGPAGERLPLDADAATPIALGRGTLGLDDPKLSRLHSHVVRGSPSGWEIAPQGKSTLKVYRAGASEAEVVKLGAAAKLHVGDRLVLGKKDGPSRELTVQRAGTAPAEKRPDPEDYQQRTEAEFEAKYGGLAEWEEAETRLDPVDMIPYTQAQFLETYGGTAEWEMAGEALIVPRLEAEVADLMDKLQLLTEDKLSAAADKQFKAASKAKSASIATAAELRTKKKELEAKVAAAAEKAEAQEDFLAKAQAAFIADAEAAAAAAPEPEPEPEPEPVSSLAARFSAQADPAAAKAMAEALITASAWFTPAGWSAHYPPPSAPEPEPEPEPVAARAPVQPQAPLRPARIGPGSQWKVVMSGMLNVRSQPALKAPSVGSKKTDAVVECFELREEWIRISPEGQKPKSSDGRPFLACIDPGRLPKEVANPKPAPAAVAKPKPAPQPQQQDLPPPPPLEEEEGMDLPPPPPLEEMEPDTEWQVNLADGHGATGGVAMWRAYDDNVQRLLHMAMPHKSSLTLDINGTNYYIDFSGLKQRNTATGFERRIRNVSASSFSGVEGFETRKRGNHSDVWTHANTLMMSTWISRDRYEFTGLIKVEEVHNPKLQQAYDRHKEELAKRVEAAAGLQGGSSSGTVLDPVDPSVHANETLVFHGCAPEAVESICLNGFQKVYWQSATGSWQRFGPGFYFALQANKSHSYPAQIMRKLPPGDHSRQMILSRVARGRVHETTKNLSHLKGAAPDGFDSVHGKAGMEESEMNDDELVVYDEGAILPFAVVTYGFTKMEK